MNSSPIYVSKPRLHYFDMLKGMAIFLVVMGHVLTFCIRGIDRAFLFKLIGEVHMPLFFFISGWFSFRVSKSDGRLMMPALGKRAVQLLLPMLVVSSLWIFYFPRTGLESPLVSTFDGLWSASWKNGYWFTPVLFVIVCLYAAVVPVVRKVKSIAAEVALFAVCWFALFAINTWLIGDNLRGWLSFDLIVWFYPVFVAGMLCRRHKDGFENLSSNGWFTFLCFAIGAFSFYIMAWPWEFDWVSPVVKDFVRPVLHFCIAVIAIAAVKPWSETCFNPARTSPVPPMAKIWCKIGEASLSIYLLHYFLLFPLGGIRPALEAFNLGFVPLFVVSAAVAAVIVTLVMIIDRIISVSSPLSMLLTGSMITKKSSKS